MKRVLRSERDGRRAKFELRSLTRLETWSDHRTSRFTETETGYYLSRIRSRIRGCNTIINNARNIHLTTLQETRDENYLKKNK